MTTSAAELIGERYELGELLGVGGTASVYAARDVLATSPKESGTPAADSTDDESVGSNARPNTKPNIQPNTEPTARPNTGPNTGPTIAIKMLHQHLCRTDGARAAFLAEAEHVSQLQHHSIAQVHGWGLHDGGGITLAWIAMDLVEGLTLAEWVEARGPLTPANAARMCLALLDGLETAHRAGIVHRDLTPKNIVLRGSKYAPFSAVTPTIIDFGLADASGKSGRDDTGDLLGTANFVSPEHAQGLPVRASADLYQLGAVLYFAVTGRAPFERATAEDTLQAHLSAPPPVPSALVPSARSLDRVVTRAMTKTPVRRYRDAAEFREALREAIDNLPRPARTDAGVAAGGSNATQTVGTTGTTVDAATTVLPGTTRGGVGSGAIALPEHDPGYDVNRSGPIWTVVTLIGLLALAAAVVFVWMQIAASDSAPKPAPAPTEVLDSEPTPTVQPTESAPPTDTAPPAPELIAVPTLHGTTTDAEAQLAAAGLVLGNVHRQDSAQPEHTVLSQFPASGVELEAGSIVDITVASGYNLVPQFAGYDAASAAALLESAGFLVTFEPAGGEADGGALVSATRPGAGAVLRLGVTVTLVLEVVPDEEPPPVDGSETP